MACATAGRQRARLAGAARLVEPVATARRSASMRCRVAFLSDNPARDSARSSGTPSPKAGTGGDHRDLTQPVLVQQPPDVLEHRRSAARGGTAVDVVQHDEHHAGVTDVGCTDSGRGPPRRRTSAGRAPTPAGRRASRSGRPRRGRESSVESWSGRSSRTTPSISRSSRLLVAAGSCSSMELRSGLSARRDAEPLQQLLRTVHSPRRRTPWPRRSSGAGRPPRRTAAGRSAG